ncbi:MAG: family 20 glycosylhydrolase [Clostridiales bacterium]|nr:family 20 glycosylhydrolase [Clostridiales bacterium]
MYIGKLNTKDSKLSGSYSYRNRGTKHPFPPNKIFSSSGADKGEINFGTGSLCSGNPVGWNWESLMDVGLDVRIDLSKECFVGAVCIELLEESAVQAVEVFSEANSGLKCIGRFDAQTGGLLEGEFTVPVSYHAQVLVVRFISNLKDIVISKLDVIGAIPDSPNLYPSPVNAKFEQDKISLHTLKTISLADDSQDAEFAAKYLQNRVSERFDYDLSISQSDSHSLSLESENGILLGIDNNIKEEGYKVSISSEGANLTASNRLSLLYAIEAFVQLCDNGKFPMCEIEDYPYKPIRGFHIGLPPREEIEFAKRLIRYVLIPMRYNILIVEFAGGMRFDRHPKISEAWVQGNQAGIEGTQPLFPHGSMVAGGELLEKDEVRDFVKYVKSFGIEVIPEVQSWGHVQYITYAYPEIAELAEEAIGDKKMDTRSADQPPSTFYHHSYCPSLDKSYEIIYDIIDEIVEVVQPEHYVHMGHDEIYQIGICPRCKDIDHSDLYAKHVTRMRDYLKDKGLRMMIWSDMLHSTERYLTYPAITKLPKDIVMLDFIWYFHFDIDMEDHILPHGFDVVMGNMYSSHYPRFESRMAKEGMIGGQVSTWCRLDEYYLAKKGKIFDLLYSAEMLWSDSYNSNAREVYTRIVQEMIPQVRDELRGISKPETYKKIAEPIALPQSATPSLPRELNAEIKDILGAGNGNANDSICSNAFDLSQAQRLTDTSIKVEVSKKYSKLVFLHATSNNAKRIAWEPLTQVGEYIVKYSDNKEVVIPVEYAGNISVWTRPFAKPMPQQFYRHQGYVATYMSDPLIQAKTEDGKDITALGYEWVNPYPDNEIVSISCSGNGLTDAEILLLGISGIR